MEGLKVYKNNKHQYNQHNHNKLQNNSNMALISYRECNKQEKHEKIST